MNGTVIPNDAIVVHHHSRIKGAAGTQLCIISYKDIREKRTAVSHNTVFTHIREGTYVNILPDCCRRLNNS